MGDVGNLRPRRLAEEAQGHAPWKAKYLEWKSTFFFNRALFLKTTKLKSNKLSSNDFFEKWKSNDFVLLN
ncbi:hypothetical protein GCM10007380_03390 [Gottfriedia solisilvae]|uniref:Uncharacterized protein n=1 Tax=Gottfriedia solisilvae TaxID=1516104 RepID=A0A8J3ETW0_9BACI|nr:hypothetical protein GCM10007380_03390 [Gottfriedia solisilvae]